MINLILGFLTGIASAVLFLKSANPAWYVWALFIPGSGALILGFDVLAGSLKEHEQRAAVMGFLLFGVPGAALIAASWIMAF